MPVPPFCAPVFLHGKVSAALSGSVCYELLPFEHASSVSVPLELKDKRKILALSYKVGDVRVWA